jgi:CDP-glycerol glycerophosphotransferase (TagB/SpsB family)
VVEAAKEMEFPDFVFDVSTYMDSEELVSAFDIVVSDYSSIMFEPAFIRKPVLLYAPDLDDYLENEYDLLFDYRDLPFDMAETMEELCGNIMKFDEDAYVNRVDAFLDRYGVHEDGHASERAVDFISELLT